MDKSAATMPKRHKMQESGADRVFYAIVFILSITTFIVITYPLWFVIIASISNSDLVNQGKVTLLPKDIRFYGFQQLPSFGERKLQVEVGCLKIVVQIPEEHSHLGG